MPSGAMRAAMAASSAEKASTLAVSGTGAGMPLTQTQVLPHSTFKRTVRSKSSRTAV